MSHPKHQPLTTSKETAELLGVSDNALAKMRMEGTSPAFIKVGRRVMYHPDDVATWIAANRRTSTAA